MRRGKWLRGKERTPGIAGRLRRARLEKGMTQEQVAEAAGVNRRTVYVWEAGKAEPTQSRLRSLAELFGKPVAWFTEGAGDELTRRINLIHERVARLPVDRLELVEKFLDSVERVRTT